MSEMESWSWPPHYEESYRPDPGSRYWFPRRETMDAGAREQAILVRLREICRYAHQHAPFYRSKWDEAGFHPDQIRTLEDFESKCPVVTKADLRKSQERKPPAPLTRSKRRVYLLAALFSLDAFGGGLVVQSLVALWLYQRHGLGTAEVGTLFFCTSILSAISFLVAVRIAKHVGLVNTMVFTHIPANVCLVAIPFVDSFAVVVALFLVRAFLSQMDVPTRSSYVMAIVLPEERPAAASITSVPRSLASAVGPFIAGWLLGVSPFGWPLVAAGAVKIAYDLMLLAAFRRIRPPEEEAGLSASSRA